MLCLSSVSKCFGQTEALKNVCLTLNRGVYGLLGLNGAGKTTLFRCITGLIRMDQGQIIKPEQINYLPQNFKAYGFLTVQEMLEYFAVLHQVPKDKRKQAATEAAEKVNLQSRLSTRCNALSGGMMRRLGIAQAVLGTPGLILFDEPTAGLDPQERLHFKDIIKSLRTQDCIVILSTHIVADVSEDYDEVMIMDRGEIVSKGSADMIASKAAGQVFEISVRKIDALKEPYLVLGSSYREGEEYLRIISEKKQEGKMLQPNLEDGYFALVQKR